MVFQSVFVLCSLSVCMFINHTGVTFACLTATLKLNFLTPCSFPSTSVWKHGVSRSFWWRCGLLSVPSPCHCHPSWCLPRSSRGRYSREGTADSQRAQLPAGLACASLYSRARRVLHSTSEESGPPHSHTSALRLDFSIFTKQVVGSHTYFLPVILGHQHAVYFSVFLNIQVGKDF